MKVSHSNSLLTLLALYLIVIINNSVSAYPSLRYPTKRMLAATGDISLPANNFTIDNGVFEVWYEFSSENETNSTDSATNSTSNGIDATNSTSNSTTNGTDISNSTTNGTANATDATNSTVGSPSNGTDSSNVTTPTNGTTDSNTTVSANSTNTTDLGGANITNGTEAVNGTNTTDSSNGTNTTNSTASPTYVTFAIKFNNPGEFFSIGFGSSSMSGADIWAFELVDGAVVASDRKAFGYYEPPLDTASNGTNDLELLGYEITDTYTLVKVRRAVDTSDSNDAIIQPGSNQLIWAFANSETIEYHQNNKGALTVDLVQ